MTSFKLLIFIALLTQVKKAKETLHDHANQLGDRKDSARLYGTLETAC